MTTDYSAQYEEQIRILEKRFNELLDEQKPASLYEPCRYIITSGGKRLRPFLVLISAKAAGGEFNNAYNAAVAVELLHNFTLVHDDIMDKADLRRGRETVHIKYGLNPAILSGDNLVAIAYKNLILDCKRNTIDILNEFTNGLIEVCEGQSYDTDFETTESVTLDEYLLMIRKKTAVMAMMCCKVGALLATDDKKHIEALGDFGINLGMAFQIQDDLLDIMADQEKFGKKVGGDLVEGKKTFLYIRALEKADKADKEKLLEVTRNKGIDWNQVEEYRQLYIKLGVIDDAVSEIKKYTENALGSLNRLPASEAIETLKWLANALIKRAK
ncbi:MAG: polyprenyl synthetase [Melioribacteraceae bacterium]|nr:MAG: polyprenyl synthetase [Melioribacteraceae bacterium]